VVAVADVMLLVELILMMVLTTNWDTVEPRKRVNKTAGSGVISATVCVILVSILDNVLLVLVMILVDLGRMSCTWRLTRTSLRKTGTGALVVKFSSMVHK
jgi:hypothetical protein